MFRWLISTALTLSLVLGASHHRTSDQLSTSHSQSLRRSQRHHLRMLRARSTVQSSTYRQKSEQQLHKNKEPTLTEDELSSITSEEKDTARFVPGRVLIAGNKKCVNKCSSTHECRIYSTAAPEKRVACLGSCHKECSVCPLSAVTNDCRKACESQCASDLKEGGDSSVCWHACLEHCPCEDLGDQLYDILDLYVRTMKN